MPADDFGKVSVLPERGPLGGGPAPAAAPPGQQDPAQGTGDVPWVRGCSAGRPALAHALAGCPPPLRPSPVFVSASCFLLQGQRLCAGHLRDLSLALGRARALGEPRRNEVFPHTRGGAGEKALRAVGPVCAGRGPSQRSAGRLGHHPSQTARAQLAPSGCSADCHGVRLGKCVRVCVLGVWQRGCC